MYIKHRIDLIAYIAYITYASTSLVFRRVSRLDGFEPPTGSSPRRDALRFRRRLFEEIGNLDAIEWLYAYSVKLFIFIQLDTVLGKLMTWHLKVFGNGVILDGVHHDFKIDSLIFVLSAGS